jgi:hypothetical protein
MEVLGTMICKVDTWSLQPFGARLPHCASFYVDDLVHFISPNDMDLRMTHSILSLFEDSSGHGCNLAKCQMAPIRCNEEQLALVAVAFPCQMMDFPIKYLGIPLSFKKLPKTALQSLLDQVADKLPISKGRLMHRSGRLALIKTTMPVVPVYTSISVGLPPWLIKMFCKITSPFLWIGTDTVQNWKTLVVWSRVQQPLDLRGLAVLDLRLTDLTPDLVSVVSTAAKKRRTVASALMNQAWIQDTTGALTIPVIAQYIEIRQRLQTMQANTEITDKYLWRWEPLGLFVSLGVQDLVHRSDHNSWGSPALEMKGCKC